MWNRFSLLFGLPALCIAFLGALWWAASARVRPSGVGLYPPPAPYTCAPWEAVSDRAFGLPAGAPGPPGSSPFAGEEGFEVFVHAGRLYLGMEADNGLGARLWRSLPAGETTDAQAAWEEVIADESGRPWGVPEVRQVDHIDSLASFEGWLYASAANAGEPTGTLVYRSINGDRGTWVPANEPGFGDPANENFKDMVVFDGALCGGTWNEVSGAEVWCTRGGDAWEQKNGGGFGDPNNRIIWSSGVYGRALYFGVQARYPQGGDGRLDRARVYRTDSLDGAPQWELVFEGDPGSGTAVLLGETGGRLYFSTRSIDGVQIWSSFSGDPGSWTPASRPGITGSRLNAAVLTDGSAHYRGDLFVAVSNPVRGFRVWRLAGDGFWEPIGAAAAPDDVAAQLAAFDGGLFAWTTNYALGQAVLRTECNPADPPTGRWPGGLLPALLFCFTIGGLSLIPLFSRSHRHTAA